jgi:ABC-2 type transport system ATP-binding protein
LVRDIMADLRSRGATVFLNSHLLGEVEATCDRVAFVKQGRVAHQLSLTETGGSFDVNIRVAPVEPCVLTGLAQFGRNITRDGDNIRMRVDTECVLPEVARFLVARGANIYALHAHRKSLEEWFVEVMGEDQRPG